MPEDVTQASRSGRATVVETNAPSGSPPGYELFDEIGHGAMDVVTLPHGRPFLAS